MTRGRSGLPQASPRGAAARGPDSRYILTWASLRPSCPSTSERARPSGRLIAGSPGLTDHPSITDDGSERLLAFGLNILNCVRRVRRRDTRAQCTCMWHVHYVANRKPALTRSAHQRHDVRLSFNPFPTPVNRYKAPSTLYGPHGPAPSSTHSFQSFLWSW